MPQEKNIGIDFGTTNTVIYCRDAKGKLKKIGGKSIRSAIYFISKNEFVIGDDALKHANSTGRYSALIINFKPEIMEKFEITAENGEHFRMKGEAIARLFLSRILSDYVEIRLKKLFGTAEMTEFDKTVITVPAKFNVEQKARIKRAAQSAYFSNVGLAFEPTAAAIAALDTDVDDDIIAVYDFGGGTFDVSVIEKGGNHHFIPIAEDGDNSLGGNALTNRIAEQIILPELRRQGIEIYMDADEMEFDEENSMSEDEYLYNLITVRGSIEFMKEHFSSYEIDREVELVILHNGVQDLFSFAVSKEQFEDAIREPVQRTVEITRHVLSRVKNDQKHVHKIIMAGGSSQLSLAEEMLREEFEHEGISVILSDSVFDLIAKGALLLAEQQKLIRVEEKTTTQFGVGVRTGIGIKKFDMLIDTGCALPVKNSKRFVIDEHILSAGEVEIPCYEKDVKSFPEAVTERDEGITHINTYRIAVDRRFRPSEIEVTFRIETDGTLCLSACLFDQSGRMIEDFNAEIMSDSELEQVML